MLTGRGEEGIGGEREAHLVIELEVRVHLQARVERLDGVPVTPVAVVQEPDTVPKTGVLQSKIGSNHSIIINDSSSNSSSNS